MLSEGSRDMTARQIAGGIQHCLIPAPKHIIIDRDKGDNEYYTRLFAKEQSYRAMMRILGY